MNYRDLFSLVLPIGILDHFDILDSTISDNKVDIYLVEKQIIPLREKIKKYLIIVITFLLILMPKV